MIKNKVVIFGLGDNAELAKYYFDTDSNLDVVAFVVDKEYVTDELFCGLPVFDFDIAQQKYSPEEYFMFIAVGYTDMNSVREQKYNDAKNKGYELANYVSSRATVLTDNIGDNNFILEDNTIQPFVTIGNNNVIWSGNHIGHHGSIGDHCFITSQVTISGRVTIQNNCFLGVNSTFRDNITIAYKTLVGAHAWISKDTREYDVFVPQSTKIFPKKSNELKI
jgi:sugar O-acyltransferase (sialic acid O-acetyltransferase NeuD family)